MDHLIDWLPKTIPTDKDSYQKTTIVHGDFRLDNVVFHKTEMRIIAVLDWELSTLGNPFSDLASFGLIYHLPPTGYLPGLGNFDKGMSGIPTEFKMRDIYLERMQGLGDISEEAWSFFLTYGLFKGAAIAQGVYKRSLMGSASSTRGSTFLHVCKQMSKLAVDISKQNYPYRIKAVEYSFLTYSEKFRKLRSDLIYFIERYVFCNERKFLK